MTFLYYAIFTALVMVALLLILLILVQKGRGGGLSGAFGGGGGGSAAFGAKTGDVLTWATSCFFGLFILLAVVLDLVVNAKYPTPLDGGDLSSKTKLTTGAGSTTPQPPSPTSIGTPTTIPASTGPVATPASIAPLTPGQVQNPMSPLLSPTAVQPNGLGPLPGATTNPVMSSQLNPFGSSPVSTPATPTSIPPVQPVDPFTGLPKTDAKPPSVPGLDLNPVLPLAPGLSVPTTKP